MPKEFKSVKVLNGVQLDHHESEFSKIQDVYGDGTYQKIVDLCDKICAGNDLATYTFLTGKPGSGKTLSLVALFRARAFVDGTVLGAGCGLYIQFTQLVKDMIASFGDISSTRLALEPYLSTKYLFVDDISKGERVLEPDRIENMIFREILLDRWENKKHLIATTNYDEKQMTRLIRSVFGEYALSRFQASCRFISFPDIDVRRHGIPEKKES